MTFAKLLCVFGAATMGLQANQSITWASDLNSADSQSDGVTSLDASFEFLLGTFVGITPTVNNLAQWEDAFQVFGTTNYQVSQGRFSNTQVLTTNQAPFTTSARAYIWGRNGTDPGSEWILMGKPSWVWPLASSGGPSPFGTNFLVGQVDAQDVIIGSVDPTNARMQTSLAEFDLPYLSWVSQNFQSGEDGSAAGDFDQDGRSNFLEYALGSDPKVVDPAFVLSLSSDDVLDFPRALNRQVEWMVESSGDLDVFSPASSGFQLDLSDPARVVITLQPVGANPQFFRVKAAEFIPPAG